MKKQTDVRCSVCKKGVCLRIAGSILEESLAQAIYQCDRCGQRFKFQEGTINALPEPAGELEAGSIEAGQIEPLEDAGS